MPAQRRRACKPRGPGRKTSPPHSHASRRYPHQPDTGRSDTRENIPTPRRTRPAKPAPTTQHNHRQHPQHPAMASTGPTIPANTHPTKPRNPKHSHHAHSCTIRANAHRNLPRKAPRASDRPALPKNRPLEAAPGGRFHTSRCEPSEPHRANNRVPGNGDRSS